MPKSFPSWNPYTKMCETNVDVPPFELGGAGTNCKSNVPFFMKHGIVKKAITRKK